MIRALIVDDERLARRGVAQMLQLHGDVDVVGEARSASTALAAIQRARPDVVFLDIQMPVAGGFDLLAEITVEERAQRPLIVFVTAFDSFAVRAYECDAIDYLLKPLHAERFAATMQRVRDRLGAHGSGSAPAHGPEVERLVIPGVSGVQYLQIADVDWIEADDYYSAVHVDGRRYLLRESLSSLEGRLHGFVRVHRGALVRMSRVRALHRAGDGSDGILVLCDGTRVRVSRRRIAGVARALRTIPLAASRAPHTECS